MTAAAIVRLDKAVTVALFRHCDVWYIVHQCDDGVWLITNRDRTRVAKMQYFPGWYGWLVIRFDGVSARYPDIHYTVNSAVMNVAAWLRGDP